ncbi:hypothetical protein MmTuc01_0927 [Methanosarcina mazei Tuc01]|uniref:Uncharacterized protein n=1 Tax=Methanosarcina mazei Tuc01 TaxID=1236903 RepID=M1P7D2_METMZ|nr:hypothetical protein MmTuc01_0927 [Methanosarcina mazei Tuc01]
MRECITEGISSYLTIGFMYTEVLRSTGQKFLPEKEVKKA